MKSYKWEVLGKFTIDNSQFSIADELLKNRGIENKEQFLNPKHPQELTLKELEIDEPQVKKAILRIKKTIKTKEKIIIYGDYDADGVCSTAILWEALYSLKANVTPFLPDRFVDGYGINSKTVEKLKTDNPDLKLIITVDNGIVANSAIETAKRLGIDVIITDHHEKDDKLPQALAIIHTTKICGSGVAWIFAREVTKSNSGLELAGIGTIADQMPLLGPNRSFAKFGLEALVKAERKGLNSLLTNAAVDKAKLGTYEVNFIIAPRLNAAGRLTNAIDALRLLCTTNLTRAGELANVLNDANLERQKTLDTAIAHARDLVNLNSKTIVIAHEDYHEGVIGLVASRLAEEFYRPVIVIAKKEKIAKASARSISGFDMIASLRKVKDLWLEGGGHPMAAGFSIDNDKITEFVKRFEEVNQELLTDEILTRKLKIDLELHFSQINWQLVKDLQKFMPFGVGNPSPVFVTKNAKIVDSFVMGSLKNHLKLILMEDKNTLEAVAFNMAEIGKELKKGDFVDVVYSIEENVWNGNKAIQLKVKDFRKSVLDK